MSGTGRQDPGYPWHEPEHLNPFLFRQERGPAAPLEPEVLAALWDVPPREVAGLLDDLAGRHDFVLSSRRRLHQEVRETILAYLLDPVQRPEAIEMNARAAACYRARASHPGHRSVDAQLADEQWQADMTALLWHTLWATPDAGIGLLCELTRAALTADSDFAAALADCAGFFAPACRPRHQQLIAAIQAMSRPWFSQPGAVGVQETVKALTAPAVNPVLASSPPPAAYSGLLRARYAEELGLTGPERAALLVRAAQRIPADGQTSRALADTARTLAGHASDYRQAPAQDQQVVASAVHLITRDSPDDSYAHATLGNALFDLGRYAEAEAAYRDALRADPDYVIAYNNLGRALYELGRYAEAEAAYRDALRTDPDYAYSHNGLGVTLYELGRYTEAEAAYRDALRADPDYAIAHNNLGRALSELGRYAEAEAAYRDALRADPDYAIAHNNLGRALYELGRYAEAEAAYRDALRTDPDYAYSHNGLGVTLYELGRYTEAEAAYRDALRADPDYANAHNNLGHIYLYVLGDTEKARASWNLAVRCRPDDVGAHANLGSLHVAAGDLSAARSSFERAAQAAAPAVHPHTELMLGVLSPGEDGTAARHFKAALDALSLPGPGLTVLSPFRRVELRALALAGLGRADDALAALASAPAPSDIDRFRATEYDLFLARIPSDEMTELARIRRAMQP